MFAEFAKNVSLVNNVHVSRQNLVSVVHFVTNRCNARCSFCFIDFDNPETFAHELTLDEVDTMTRNLGPNLQNVNITGGEPFARKDLVEIVDRYFSNTEIKSIFITSNGSLPDRIENLCEFVSKKHPSRKVFFQFSIDDLGSRHDQIRKIEGLFENVIRSYHVASGFNKNIEASIAITVSHENYKTVAELYSQLITHHKVQNIALNIVRDEGVYRIPKEQKNKILGAYIDLSERLKNDKTIGALKGWDTNTLQGRLMNKKNEIWRKTLIEIYEKPEFRTPCMAGSIFGIIEPNGEVKPCEILQKSIGNLRDFDMDFVKLWSNHQAQDMRRWIKETKCHCHYDCAWSFNILAGRRYQPSLLRSLLSF